jgi:hypothetical protein
MKNSTIIGVLFSAVAIMLTAHIAFCYDPDPFTTITTVPGELNLSVSPDGTITPSPNVTINFDRDHFGFGCTHIHYISAQGLINWNGTAVSNTLFREGVTAKPNLCGFDTDLVDTIPAVQITGVCEDRWGSTVTVTEKYRTRMISTQGDLEDFILWIGTHGVLDDRGKIWEKTINMPVNIDCECTTPRFSGNDMQKATSSQNYSHNFSSQVTNGKRPYRFSHAGDLPSGLTLSEDGVLSGVPLGPGIYPLQVNLDDSCPFGTQNTSENFQLYVCTESLILISPATLPEGVIGSSYTDQVYFYGIEPTTYSVLDWRDLPPGLELSERGIISGVPTSPGEYEFTVRAVDYCNTTEEQRVSLAIIPKPEISTGETKYQSIPMRLSQPGEEPKTPLKPKSTYEIPEESKTLLKPNTYEIPPGASEETGFQTPPKPPVVNPENLKTKPPVDEGKPVANAPISLKKTTVNFVGVKDSRGMRTPLSDKISIEQGSMATIDINGKDVDLINISVPRGVKIEKDNKSPIKREVTLKGSKAGKYQVRLHDRDNKVLKVVNVEVTAPEKVYTTLKKPVNPATSPNPAGKKLSVKPPPPGKPPVAKAGPAPSVKTAPMPPPALPTKTAMKKAPSQPKAGMPPTVSSPRPAKATPPPPSAAKKAAVTAKRTAGKADQAGTIQKSTPVTNPLKKSLPPQEVPQQKKLIDTTVARATIKKRTQQWTREKPDLLRSLDEIARDARIKPAVKNFQKELDSVDKTLVEARRIVDQEVSNTKQIDTVINSLKQHQRKVRNIREEMQKIEQEKETVRNKRLMASTAFQNFDQKTNQLYNLLSSVMKAMNEMRMGTVRNML